MLIELLRRASVGKRSSRKVCRALPDGQIQPLDERRVQCRGVDPLTFVSDRHLPRAVTKALELVEPESAQHGQHRVRHRRTIRAFDVEVALEVAIAVASQKERTALVVVNVRVAHWRAVEDQRLFQEIRVALGCVTEPFEEVRDGADVGTG